jgi:hypothetical protein
MHLVEWIMGHKQIVALEHFEAVPFYFIPAPAKNSFFFQIQRTLRRFFRLTLRKISTYKITRSNHLISIWDLLLYLLLFFKDFI